MSAPKLYNLDRDASALEPHYSRHVMAMTAEDLFHKSDIAAELAFRDAELERLRRHLASAQADRAEEYRQREAWRAKHGQVVEVLRGIAEAKAPPSGSGLAAWMRWGYAIQSKAAEWLPEEEG